MASVTNDGSNCRIEIEVGSEVWRVARVSLDVDGSSGRCQML